MTREMHVLLFKEQDQWVAQCLQHDIVGQGDSIDDALFGLEACLIAHLSLDLAKERQPFEGIPEAPRDCWAKYERAKELKEPANLFERMTDDLLKSVPPAFMLPQHARCDVRVF